MPPTLSHIGPSRGVAGETYCESRNELMDDRRRVMHALPGDGQNRPSAGESLIEVQERYNTQPRTFRRKHTSMISPANLRRSAGARFRCAAKPDGRARSALSGARAAGNVARGWIFSAGSPGAGAAGYAASPAGPDRTYRAVFDGTVFPRVRRRNGKCKNGERLRRWRATRRWASWAWCGGA